MNQENANNMNQILPAILVGNSLEFKEKLDIINGQVNEAQIDIMDGRFVPQETFADPAYIEKLETSIRYELHLMVIDPEKAIDGWKDSLKVRRAIIHAEIDKPLLPIIKKIKSFGWQAGVALNPETPWEKIDDLISELDTVLVMTVHPGRAGQDFGEAAASYHLLSKIFDLHEAHPDLIISVDGGVSKETLPLLLEAGASRFAVNSALWKAKKPLEMLKELNNKSLI